MKKIIWMTFLSLSLVVLAACGATGGAVPEAAGARVEDAAVTQPQQEAGAPAEPAQAEAAEPESSASGPGETLVDEQGAVSVAVTPRTLDPAATVLDFEVAMNTHSVDLSMDLAELATLTTDTGTQITANSWDAPQGGHHVSGTLSFASGEGSAFLEGANTLTLTLVNVDAAERTFTWRLK